MRRILGIRYVLLLTLCAKAQAPQYGILHYIFVAPDGASTNSGTFDSPLDLPSALAQSHGIGPGDTIWLRGGVYKGCFRSKLTGTAEVPVTVRQYPGERATLDGGTCDYALTINGAWTRYWGFEVMNSNPVRTNASAGSNPADFKRADGISVLAPHTRLINLVIHDNSQGIGFWTPAEDSEAYGNIIYFNGWDAPDRGHGHGIYAQNKNGMKHLTDNIIFDQFSHGIHIYTEGGAIDGFVVTGNIVFDNGSLSQKTGLIRNILVGGGRLAANPAVIANSTYFPLNGPGDNNIGYVAGCRDLILLNNHFAGGVALVMNSCNALDLAGNTFYGQTSGIDHGDFPDNEYVSGKPRGVTVILRPNHYEPDTTYVAVYNWDHADRVPVSAARLHLREGDHYRIRNAQDYFGAAVEGVYAGDPSVSIPMTGWRTAQPVGAEKPFSPLPEFGAFIVTVRRPPPELPRAAAKSAPGNDFDGVDLRVLDQGRE